MGVFAKARIEAIMKGAGAERISAKSIERMDELVADFGENVSKGAINFAKAAGRKTVQGDDIKLAVSKVGTPKSSPTGPKSRAFAKARVERVIRDSGADRVSGDAVEHLNKQLEAYCYTLAKSAVEMARHAKRKTVKDTDIMP
ncbi:MAG: histone [Candidatus Hodarchaeales archaeon]|jgi:histone H3/H4